MRQAEKLEREARQGVANTLIKIIAAHGRRFFWDAATDTVASFETNKGRLYYRDEYTGKLTYMYPTSMPNTWQNFSHGGTLRALVESMADYILSGRQIPRWQIVQPRREDESLVGNVWGYPVAAGNEVREAAFLLPIIAPAT